MVLHTYSNTKSTLEYAPLSYSIDARFTNLQSHTIHFLATDEVKTYSVGVS